MKKLRVLDLFSGIGGFSLGLERAGGFETVAFCEIDPYCRRVLAKHWPNVPIYEDVRELTADTLSRDGIAVDAICGGFPCQDVSNAGKRAGFEGSRSSLWFELARLIGEIRPVIVVVENVPGLLTSSAKHEPPGRDFGRVLGSLAEIGYNAAWDCISAGSVGAPHLRDRVWIVAQPQHPHPNDARSHRATIDIERGAEFRHEQECQPGPLRAHVSDARGESGRPETRNAERGSRGEALRTGTPQSRRRRGDVADADDTGLEIVLDGETGQLAPAFGTRAWRTEPDVGRVAYGVPSRVDRLRSLGNAVVPQIPELIGRAIQMSVAKDVV